MTSNYDKGEQFANHVGRYLVDKGLSILPEYEVEVGWNSRHKKLHKFDWGNESLLVECKTYTWTEGRNNPSAKLTTVNEAMMYFATAPESYRKMLFFSATEKKGSRDPKTLGEYYVSRFKHWIPDDVEIYELDSDTLRVKRLWALKSSEN